MTPKRILVSYFFGHDTIPLGKSCARAFRQLGFEVYCFNSQVESQWYSRLLRPINRTRRALGFRQGEIGKDLPISRVHFKRRMLLKAAREVRPQWIFVIRAHEFVDEALIQELTHGCGVEKVFAWRVDGPPNSADLLADSRIYDHYFCSHRSGYDPRKDGIAYLPVCGMDFWQYRNLHLQGPRAYHHDVVLVGGHNPRRQHFVESLLDLPLEIYGKWRKQNKGNFALLARVKAKGIWGDDLLGLYNSSKIVLNITGWDPAQFSGLNQRIFDVPATGAFLLTDYSPELEEYYRVGDEIVCFRGIEELKERAAYYLTHTNRREAIARKGYERALTLPTIVDRMKCVIATVNSPSGRAGAR